MKKSISAEVIADSKNQFGQRITTFIVTFPRMILAEFNTHRMFSRNSASSRAIPFEKMLKMVQQDPFIPIAFQKDHKGMQGTEYFTDEDTLVVEPGEGGNKELKGSAPLILKEDWLLARDQAVLTAKMLSGRGVTKQLCNRLLEPFMWHTVIVTATEWENFFYLRCPQYELGKTVFRSKKDVLDHVSDDPDYYEELSNQTEVDWLKINQGAAEIHAMRLAECMWDAMNESTPKELKAGEWHIPFGDNLSDERIINFERKETDGSIGQSHIDEIKIKIATARCARVSYMNFEGKDDYEADIKLHDKLAEMGHWSPFEHCAKAMDKEEGGPFVLKVNTEHITPEQRDQIKKYWESLNSAQTLMVLENCNPEVIPLNGDSGNFKGFIQYRKMFDNENVTKDGK